MDTRRAVPQGDLYYDNAVGSEEAELDFSGKDRSGTKVKNAYNDMVNRLTAWSLQGNTELTAKSLRA